MSTSDATQLTLKDAAAARTRDARALFSLIPSPTTAMFNPVEAVNESTRLTKRLVQVNVDYARDLAGAVRKHVTGLVDIMNDEVLTSARLVNHQAEKLEEAALEEAEQIEQAERAEAQRARKAAHDAAVERYQEMTKVELSEELGKRELPRTGNVDVLRDRLIDDDLKVQP